MPKSPHPRAHRRRHDTCRSTVQAAFDLDVADVGSAEYYRRREEEFDETSHTQKVYKAGTESLSGWIKELWYQYVKHTAEFHTAWTDSGPGTANLSRRTRRLR